MQFRYKNAKIIEKTTLLQKKIMNLTIGYQKRCRRYAKRSLFQRYKPYQNFSHYLCTRNKREKK